MQPESLVKLVGSGNTSTVEEEWLRLIESSTVVPSALSPYHVVLAELSRLGRTAQAETLAATAIESFDGRHGPREILPVAGAFLLGVGESQELRSRVEQLYRTSYEGRAGLDGLIRESGLGGGRPVRRALRTLDVCLSVAEGDYLMARDEDTAARIEKINTDTWTFTIKTPDECEQLTAMQLADRFEAAAATDFQVIKHFAPQELVAQLNKDPVAMLIDLCKRHGGSVDSTKLELLLVPSILSEGEWDKWWAKARTALRKCKNIKVEGRSPYYLHYAEEVSDGGDALVAEFKKTRDPMGRLDLIERRLRDRKNQGEEVSKNALRQCHEVYMALAEKDAERRVFPPIILWTVAAKLAEIAGLDDKSAPLQNLLRDAVDLPSLFRPLDNEALAELACNALPAARPADWSAQLLNVLPFLPTGVCDHATTMLRGAGRTREELESAIQQIQASPIECFDALLWLWDGPEYSELTDRITLVTILTRILKALDHCRRDEQVPREVAKRVSARARTVLSARRYERFHQCIKEMDRGMAHALRVQINQLDNLGRAVYEDLLNHMSRAFPSREAQPATPPWLREDILYVTRMGLARKQDEIDHHVNVKMRENAKAIGAAAEHGDLSENSEYKFALEERDLLRARLAHMNAELGMARVLTPADVSADQVSIGSRVSFRRVDDGKCYEMTFVGPWEADHTKHWFNYRAPFAQAVLGKRIGDVVEFDHGEIKGRYEIVELHNAIADLADADSAASPQPRETSQVH